MRGRDRLPEARGSSRGPRRRTPLLVLRFALVSALGVGLAAAAILYVVRGLATTQAQRSANETVGVVADAVLRPALRPSDFHLPVVGERRAELDRLFDERLLRRDTQSVTLMRADGLVTYSTRHVLIGRGQPSAYVAQAARGQTVSTVLGPAGADAKRLRTFVPLGLRGTAPGVAVFDTSYAPVAAAAGDVFFPVAGVLEALLVGLFVALVPLLRRVSLRIERQIDAIEHAAWHDDLTGLPNRVLFQERLAEALVDGGEIGPAVLMLDIDDFRDVNDALGHARGDALLCAVAKELARTLDDSATLARFGGDGFAVLLPRAPAAMSTDVARQALSVFDEPIDAGGLPLAVGATVGIAVAPGHGDDPAILVQRADIAMHAAKQPRTGLAIYDPDRDEIDPERLRLFADLKQALAARELSLAYQPRASLVDRSIVGVEALVRWSHPERGPVPPDVFVPLAERTGLMKELTRHVLDLAVAQAAAWEQRGLDLRVSINLSAIDLLDAALPDEIERRASAAGLALGSLEVEVTETAAMSDPARTREVLRDLSRRGLAVAIDDFGTGHSSLAYLSSLPATVLKIDRSFVEGMDDGDDATILRSTVELGRNLGLEVVAEGVETAAQWEALRAFGCHQAQGYLIAAPLPAEELTAWLTGLGAAPEAHSADGLKAA